MAQNVADACTTSSSIQSLINGTYHTPLSDVHGKGPLLLSKIPASCCTTATSQRKKPVIHMGVDEAGRGPALGPMVYAAAYWSTTENESETTSLFRDSKVLTHKTRLSLFEKIESSTEIGYVVRCLPASEISRNMLRSQPYNLNEMSHDAVMEMIASAKKAGVLVDHCYVDTVGNPASYQRKLENRFPEISFTVEKKADAKYASCSAASVVAKVVRDLTMERWNFTEGDCLTNTSKNFGSGYPSDPKCKAWVEKNASSKVFCYPDLARFSWGPLKAAVKTKGVCVEWEADEDDEDETGGKRKRRDSNQSSMNQFFPGEKDKTKPRRRMDYFEKMGLSVVSDLVKT